MSIIYKITNNITDKSYIGQTIQTLSNRWRGHCYKVNQGSNTYFHNAIRKYGIECWLFELLEEVDDELLNEREIYWIEYYDTLKNGYNIDVGGSNRLGYKHSLETIKKLSDSHKGYKQSTVHKQNISNAQMGQNKGKIFITDGNKLKFIWESELNDYKMFGFYKGRPNWFKEKQSAGQLGCSHKKHKD